MSMIESRTLHRNWDRDTSIHAAEQIAPSVSELQAEVLAYAFKQGKQGFTDDELNLSMMSISSTYRSRRAELTRMGKIADSGKRIEIEGQRIKRKAIVWIHSDFIAN